MSEIYIDFFIDENMSGISDDNSASAVTTPSLKKRRLIKTFSETKEPYSGHNVEELLLYYKASENLSNVLKDTYNTTSLYRNFLVNDSFLQQLKITNIHDYKSLNNFKRYYLNQPMVDFDDVDDDLDDKTFSQTQNNIDFPSNIFSQYKESEGGFLPSPTIEKLISLFSEETDISEEVRSVNMTNDNNLLSEIHNDIAGSYNNGLFILDNSNIPSSDEYINVPAPYKPKKTKKKIDKITHPTDEKVIQDKVQHSSYCNGIADYRAIPVPTNCFLCGPKFQGKATIRNRECPFYKAAKRLIHYPNGYLHIWSATSIYQCKAHFNCPHWVKIFRESTFVDEIEMVTYKVMECGGHNYASLTEINF